MSHIDRKIAKYPGSYARISTQAAVDTAIVFVHGFWGGSIATWRKIQSLIDSVASLVSKTGNCDFYFYDFKTADDTLNGHADEFLKFLADIFPDAQATIFASKKPKRGAIRRLLRLRPPVLEREEMARTGPLKYKELVLVGHSMGGVIVRRAVLNNLMHAGTASPYSRAKLRLFAPAHAGIRMEKAIDQAMTEGVGRLIYAAFLVKYRAFVDVLEGSKVLEELKDDHTKMATHPARGAHVLWAKGDYVVNDLPLAGDTEERVPGKNHRTVCKPRQHYLLPLERVLS